MTGTSFSDVHHILARQENNPLSVYVGIAWLLSIYLRLTATLQSLRIISDLAGNFDGAIRTDVIIDDNERFISACEMAFSR